jgi:plastocyanin
MQDKCPKCGEPLITKSIKKELGTGSIDYPVAQICSKCGWSRDLTGAGEIVSKPLVAKEELKPQSVPKAPKIPKPAPTSKPLDFNKIITIVLALLVIGGLIWAFYPTAPKQVEKATPTPTPTITQTAVQTPVGTPVAEVTPTGKSIPVFLDSRRGFTRNKEVTIKAGDEVVWRNTGTTAVTLVGNTINKTLAYDKEYRHIFNETGTYKFYLKENNSLTGTITVKP